MTYRPEDYKVKGINYNEDGTIRSFDVNIKGADFTVYRYLNNYKPTSIFKFNDSIRFVGKYNKDGDLVGGCNVEIDWNTCVRGLNKLAEEMGLKLIPGTHFPRAKRLSYFVEVTA